MDEKAFLDYAGVIFQRERLLDSYDVVARVVTRGFFKKRTEVVLEGDVEQALRMLEGYAQSQKVPFVAGDIERTNRVPEHEARMQQDPAFRQAVRRAYAMDLLGSRSNFNPRYMPPEYEPQVQAAMQNELLKSNPFVPLVERRPKVQEAFLGGSALSVG
ncbi:MAG: hypothetical protein KC731_32585 [Myxococcales bacterium]|nr:hypothetical protein [Myxococcales bacterium]